MDAAPRTTRGAAAAVTTEEAGTSAQAPTVPALTKSRAGVSERRKERGASACVKSHPSRMGERWPRCAQVRASTARGTRPPRDRGGSRHGRRRRTHVRYHLTGGPCGDVGTTTKRAPSAAGGFGRGGRSCVATVPRSAPRACGSAAHAYARLQRRRRPAGLSTGGSFTRECSIGGAPRAALYVAYAAMVGAARRAERGAHEIRSRRTRRP